MQHGFLHRLSEIARSQVRQSHFSYHCRAQNQGKFRTLEQYRAYCYSVNISKYSLVLGITPGKLAITARYVAPILAIAIFAGALGPRLTVAQTRAGTHGGAESSGEEADRRGREAFARKDYASALSWLRKAADRGDAEAQAKLGLMYYEGLGVKQDFAQAFTWYLKAAKQDHVVAEEIVGNMYRWGKGVTKDYALAVPWLRKAADSGSSNARTVLGTMYLVGEGVPQDFEEAAKWLQRGEEQNASPVHASTVKADVTLWCDQPTLGGGIVKSVVSIDTGSKYVKVETPGQGTVEFRDGAFGKIVTSGYMAPEAINLQQFVSVENNVVTFGTKKKGGSDVHTIDLNTGLFRTGGRITPCKEAKAQR